MKYLSIDIEATGLEEHDFIIEFAMIPIDAKNRLLRKDLEKHFYIKCPSFDDLRPKLSEWVIKHNKELITKAHTQGINIDHFKEEIKNYCESQAITFFFDQQPIILFGKSLNAIDLPFLNRDLGYEFMRKYFSHRTNDLTSFTCNLIDLDILPQECISGSKLMNHLHMGNVAHTALEDAQNTALMYFKLLDLVTR